VDEAEGDRILRTHAKTIAALERLGVRVRAVDISQTWTRQPINVTVSHFREGLYPALRDYPFGEPPPSLVTTIKRLRPHLRRLEADFCLELERVHEPLPDGFAVQLAKIPNLRGICIRHSRAVETIPQAERLPQVEELNLTFSGPTDDGLASVGKMTGLKRLGLQHSPRRPNDQTSKVVTDRGLVHLSGLYNLEELDLGDSAVTGAGLAHLKDLPCLKWLNLHSTPLTDEGFANIAQLTHLEGVQFFYTDISDDALVHLSQLAELRRLTFRDMPNVTSDGLIHLRGLSKLEQLCLRRKSLTPEVLTHLRDLPNLRSLNLYQNHLTDAGLALLAEHDNLDTLFVSGQEITDQGVAHLAGLQKLERLALKETSVTDEGLAYLLTLRHLQWLDLWGSTGITDVGLTRLRLLKKLRWLRVWELDVSDEALEALGQALPDLVIERALPPALAPKPRTQEYSSAPGDGPVVRD
jgi:hypothetical protein